MTNKKRKRTADRARARRREKDRKGRQRTGAAVPPLARLCDNGACALAGREAEWLIKSTGPSGAGLPQQRRCDSCKVGLDQWVAQNPNKGYEIEITRIVS